MKMDTADRAKRLLVCLGEIADSFLDETEAADIAAWRAVRRRVVQVGAVAAAASVGVAGIATACWFLRAGRVGRVGCVSEKLVS